MENQNKNQIDDTAKPSSAANVKRQKADELSKTMQCNCDLDNWQPDERTGHSWVCRIHRAVIGNPLHY